MPAMSRSLDQPGARERVLAWMCVIIAINQLGFGALVPVLPLYAQSFGVPASAIGSTIAVYGLARFVVAVPAGRMSDRLGRRAALAIGGLVSAAGCFWCALAVGFTEFLAARFVSGAGAAIIVTVGSVVLADISTPERRGRMMAAYQGTFLFAVGIGPLPGGLLAERYGLAVPFWIYGIAGLIAGTVAWFAVPETRDLGHGGKGAASRVPASMIGQTRMLFAQVGYRLVCMLGLVGAMVRTGALFAVVPLIGAGKLGLSAGQIGFGFALGSVLGLVASYPAGALADRFGRKPVIVPATVVTGLSLVAYCYAPSFAWFVFACVVWGVASAVNGAAPSAYAADSAPPGMNAAAMSSYRMLSDVGYVVGPIGLGLLVDWQGTEPTMLVSAALLLVTAALFQRHAPETLKVKRPLP